MLPVIPLLFALMQSSAWGPATPPASMPHIQDGCSGISMGPGGPRVLRWAGCESRYWDVVCPMSSDTCSDGRKITTVRASPAQCETAPGVWTTVPADTGCYGVRGLESWAQTTSYLSWGAELDRSPWGPSSRGGAIEAIADGWRVSKALDEPNSGWAQRLTGMGDGAMWTTSYILRTMTPIPMALYAGSSQSCGQETLDTGGQWQTLSCSREVPAPSDPVASIYPGANTTGTPYSVDAKAAWTVRGDTPGRACWGGEAPVTCDADRHTISTEGWPTEEGEISISFVSGDPAATGRRTLFAGNAQTSCRLWILPSGNLQIGNCPDWPSNLGTEDVQIRDGGRHTVTIRRRAGRVSIWLDGEQKIDSERPPLTWDPEVHLGTTGTTNHLNGSISRLSWRTP